MLNHSIENQLREERLAKEQIQARLKMLTQEVDQLSNTKRDMLQLITHKVRSHQGHIKRDMLQLITYKVRSCQGHIKRDMLQLITHKVRSCQGHTKKDMLQLITHKVRSCQGHAKVTPRETYYNSSLTR